MEKEFVLGIDGGGTSAGVMAGAIDGTPLGAWTFGALNINGQTYEQAADTVFQIVQGLEKEGLSMGGCRGICIGAAGISNDDTAKVLRKALKECGMTGVIMVAGDQETALAAASEKLWGVVLIAGTGSICYGKNQEGRSFRAGGFGHLIDDEGSAYAIGRDILKAVVKSTDGRGADTILKELLYQRLSVSSPQQLVTWLYGPERTKKEIAALAVLVREGEDAGDRETVRILKNAGKALAELASPVLGSIPEADCIILSGSVLTKNRKIREEFTAGLKKAYPKVTPRLLKEPAPLGALRIIRKELGYL